MMIAANIISLTVLFAVPLLLVALGGMFSEHSGVINIALEGMMIIGALFACFTLQAFDKSGFGPAHPQLAMLAAILVAGLTGTIFSFFLGFAAINLKADQTIGGTALNQFAPAFAVVMTWAIQGQGLTTIAIPSWVRITRDTFGLAPVDGPSFWNNLIFKYFYLTTPVAVVLFIAAYMQQFIGEEFDGEVSGVQSFGVFVALENGCEGLIRAELMAGDFYQYDEEHMAMVGRRTGKRFTIGTPLRVKLLAASEVTGQIDFAPAEGSLPVSEKPERAPRDDDRPPFGNRASRRRQSHGRGRSGGQKGKKPPTRKRR